MNVILRIEGEEIATTLQSFLSDNDGFTDAEVLALVWSLEDGVTYRGGGGSSPLFTLERVKP